MRVSVIGGGSVAEGDEHAETAFEVGRILAQRGHTVVCGGLGGVMEHACRGAQAANGDTIGILPGTERSAANDYVDTVVVTGLNHARNALVVMNGDAVIAVDGGGGTLSEIGFGHVYDRPVAGLGTHDAPGVDPYDEPKAAVKYVEEAAGP